DGDHGPGGGFEQELAHATGLTRGRCKNHRRCRPDSARRLALAGPGDAVTAIDPCAGAIRAPKPQPVDTGKAPRPAPRGLRRLARTVDKPPRRARLCRARRRARVTRKPMSETPSATQPAGP